MSINKILVPTDFSIHAGMALEYAFGLAQAFKSQVTLFHTYELPTPIIVDGGAYPSAELLQMLEQKANTTLSAATEDARRSWKGRPAAFSSELAMGPAALRIVEKARRGGYDLIVMGTHGREGLPHLFLGSTAEGVMRAAECPVLTIRATLGALLTDSPRGADIASTTPSHATVSQSD